MAKKTTSTLTCQECGVSTARTGYVQKYCPECSEKRDMQRKKLWARENPPSDKQTKRNRAFAKQRESKARERGRKESIRSRTPITWDQDKPDFIWKTMIAVPFSSAFSKNHIYSMSKRGHVFLRKETRAVRDHLTLRIKQQLPDLPLVHNKLWVSLFVQKPNHKFDAINMIAVVCDAIKDAFPLLDDRWFCIYKVDWEIVKENPLMYVGMGQDVDFDAQACSYCGQIKPLAAFNRDKHRRLGIGRECKQCRTGNKPDALQSSMF